MTSVARKILEDALALPSSERAALVVALSDSLEGEPTTLNPAWQTEVASRIDQLERGALEPVEWAQVEARISSVLTRK